MEVLGGQCRRLPVDHDGALVEIVDVVGHRQFATPGAGVRLLESGGMELPQRVPKLDVDVLFGKRRQPHL